MCDKKLLYDKLMIVMNWIMWVSMGDSTSAKTVLRTFDHVQEGEVNSLSI